MPVVEERLTPSTGTVDGAGPALLKVKLVVFEALASTLILYLIFSPVSRSTKASWFHLVHSRQAGTFI